GRSTSIMRVRRCSALRGGSLVFIFFNDTATTEIYTLSLHDALPIFAAVRPDTMAAQVVTGLLERTRLDPALIEDVILGCAYSEGPQGSNLARIVAFLAGLPLEVGGMTVNRFCGSSMLGIQRAAGPHT